MSLERGDLSSRRLLVVAAAIVAGAAAAVAGAILAGCALGVGLDEQAAESADAADGDVSEASPPKHADAATDAPILTEFDAGSDGRASDASRDGGATDAGSAADDAASDAAHGEDVADAGAPDTASSADAGTAPDAPAGDEAGPESGPGVGVDTGADASGGVDTGAGADAEPDVGLNAGPDTGAEAGADAGCTDPPQVTLLTPTSNQIITVHSRNPSTYTFAFSAHVDFPCAPMQDVQFDYGGPSGTVSSQEKIFTSYVDPFTQQTQVGGSGSSLQASNNGENPSSWLFTVSATDADGRNTTVNEPFTLVISNH